MLIKNMRTGAIIDCPFAFTGADWIIAGDEKIPDGAEKQRKEEHVEMKEVPDKADASDSMTKADIMQELDSLGVSYDKKASKKALYTLMMEQ